MASPHRLRGRLTQVRHYRTPNRQPRPPDLRRPTRWRAVARDRKWRNCCFHQEHTGQHPNPRTRDNRNPVDPLPTRNCVVHRSGTDHANPLRLTYTRAHGRTDTASRPPATCSKSGGICPIGSARPFLHAGSTRSPRRAPGESRERSAEVWDAGQLGRRQILPWRAVYRIERSLPTLWNSPVRRWVSLEPDSIDLSASIEPGSGDPVAAIHQTPAGVEDDRVAQISRFDAPCVFGHLTAAGRTITEPTVLIELDDVSDGNRPHAQGLRCSPEALRPPELSNTGDDVCVGLSLALHRASITHRSDRPCRDPRGRPGSHVSRHSQVATPSNRVSATGEVSRRRACWLACLRVA